MNAGLCSLFARSRPSHPSLPSSVPPHLSASWFACWFACWFAREAAEGYSSASERNIWGSHRDDGANLDGCHDKDMMKDGNAEGIPGLIEVDELDDDERHLRSTRRSSAAEIASTSTVSPLTVRPRRDISAAESGLGAGDGTVEEAREVGAMRGRDGDEEGYQVFAVEDEDHDEDQGGDGIEPLEAPNGVDVPKGLGGHRGLGSQGREGLAGEHSRRAEDGLAGDEVGVGAEDDEVNVAGFERLPPLVTPTVRVLHLESSMSLTLFNL